MPDQETDPEQSASSGNEPKIEDWRPAPRPNYEDNVDLQFPYSEYPRTFEVIVKTKDPPIFEEIVQYPYVSTRLTGQTPTRILDFWGEGRIVAYEGVSGFTNSYNVNHQFQLVSNGGDSGSKIPNRIPTVNYEDVGVEKYVPDRSFHIVTVMGGPITSKVAFEMARLIRTDNSAVIVIYGYREVGDDLKDIQNLQAALDSIGFVLSPLYVLSSQLKEPSFTPKFAFCSAANVIGQATGFFQGREMEKCAIILSSLYRGAAIQQAAGNALREFFLQDSVQNSYLIFSLGYALENSEDGRLVLRDYMNANVRRIVLGEYKAVKLVIHFGAAESYLCPYDQVSDGNYKDAFFGARSYFDKDTSAKYREGEKFHIEPVPPGQQFRIRSNFGTESYLSMPDAVSDYQWAIFGTAGYFRTHLSAADGQYFRLYPVSGGERFKLVSTYGTAHSVLLSNGKVSEGDWKRAYFGTSKYFDDPTYRDSQFLTLSFVD